MTPEPDADVLKPSLTPTEPDNVLPWSTDVHPRPQTPRALAPTAPGSPGTSTARTRVPTRSHSLKTRLAEISPEASQRLAAKFRAVKASWPPEEVALIAIKDERKLELYARSAGAPWTFVHAYRVLAASGGLGPKLRRGDRQVPEGIYRISYLNPNSAYHVSLRVNYPNAFDREMAKQEGRKDLGGDIMIHGKNLSAGCLAMGDEAAEELFVLAAEVGLPHTSLIIAPKDFRDTKPSPLKPGEPKWQADLYDKVAVAMSEFKRPQSRGLLSFFTR